MVNMKFWKHWPYWLRGGIITVGITIVDILLMYSCDLFTSGYSSLGCGLVFAVFGPIFPLFLFSESFGPFPISTEVFMMIGVIVWFIIGSLVGLLIGYIKSKKKNVQ
ncbi:MAG: hypothetical protein UY03_C0002G0021 [Parcubacteria group bacterium GW2011_GWA2_47_64]|nr:MAG: hypothetical protein UY03_C0002G0021 [Parcubacteria group bacterium GW2011_GWA2_47_64]KKU96737.1 MAG: hypothetical protein UY29_C0007G0023 [Parcubacteria group bacterium GW2011_GWC2_48_17]